MIFQNTSSTNVVSSLASAFNKMKASTAAPIRFNTTSQSCGMVKCSLTRMKVRVDVNDQRIKLTAFERVANTPANILQDYRENESLILLHEDEERFQKGAQFIHSVVSRKSEYLTHIERGYPERIVGVRTLNELSFYNVFFGVVRKITFNPDGSTIIHLDNGTFKIVNQDINLPASGNVVGRYFVLNNNKQFTFWPLIIFQSNVIYQNGNKETLNQFTQESNEIFA